MADADPGSYWLQLLLLLILIIINAFFAAAEMATVSANKTRIELAADDGNKRAQILLNLLEQPNKFLSTIQVIITLAGFLQSAFAATGMSEDVGAWISSFGIPYGKEVAVVLITLILSYFNLVLGELYPKRLALKYSEKIALFSARPILFVSKITAPFVWLLSKSVNLLLKVTGVKEDDLEERYSEEEIKSLLEVGQETGLIKEAGKEMITSIFEFDDKLAYEIMTPRTDVYMINKNEELKDYIDELLDHKFSRIPVYDKDSDDIVGVLYMKDFIVKAREFGFENVDICDILQKPFFVPESKNIDELFREMQESKTHMAFLIDEYGGFSGLVTTEDLIEEVMGNIDDEYDDDEPKMEQIGENIYLIDGHYYLDDLNEELLIDLQSDDYETIGGYMIEQLGEIPEENELKNKEFIIKKESCILKVESVLERRIEKVKLTLIKSDIDQNDSEKPDDNKEEEKE